MKYLIITLISFISFGCIEETNNILPPPPLCDYESEHPFVTEINWVMLDSIRLDTVEYFTFPYQVQGYGLSWQVSQDSVFNFDLLQKHLNNYLTTGHSEIWIDDAANVRFNFIGVDFEFEPIYNATHEGYQTEIDFIESCY